MRLGDLAAEPLTYTGAGGTLRGTLPEGFHPASLTRDIGTGMPSFGRAAEALMTWRMHEMFGMRIEASSPRAVEGADVLGRVGKGRLGLWVPCRVVWAVDEPGRVGFGYGTLAGHPECGEEAFLLEQVGETVRFTIRAFSRGGTWYTRAAGPVGRAMQALLLHRYVRCLRSLAESE